MPKVNFARACSLASLTAIMLGSIALSGPALAQTTVTDPGVRGGAAGAGAALPGLNAVETSLFDVAKDVFQEVDAVPDGLGPRFNLDSCTGCHSQPAIGGSAPAVNPQIAVAKAANNVVPPFIRLNGPVREARFVRNPDGSPDGGVHALFVITGRPDAGTCNIRQPNFAAELTRNNVVFRIPTPTFGLGLVENVTDGALENALARNGFQKRSLGVSGRFNRSGNDGTITRFGWKAQNKSLLMFSGEAYNVEIGVTNDLFGNERETDPNCQLNATPESPTPLTVDPAASTGSPSADFSSDIVLFATFMRLLAAPSPAGTTTTPVAAAATSQVASASSVLPSASGTTATSTTTTTTASATSIARGKTVFGNVGCSACHSGSLKTGKSPIAALSEKTFEPLSDFAVHNMGGGLADGVSQGGANGNEFRTAPLWGVGQRVFFLHDGRTNNIVEAIQEHASRGSEANTVINNFNLLPRSDKQALVDYLRSL
jgi:CxxC motif-containing protein (DUF1111 family)